MPSKDFLNAIETRVGCPVDKIREMTLWDHRRRAEDKHGRPMQISPVIGGFLKLLSRKEIEKELDQILQKE